MRRSANRKIRARGSAEEWESSYRLRLQSARAALCGSIPYLRACGDCYAVTLMKLRVKGGFALCVGLPALMLSALSGCSLSGRPPASIEIEKVDTVPSGCQLQNLDSQRVRYRVGRRQCLRELP